MLNARKAAELGPKVEVDMAPRERKTAGYKVRPPLSLSLALTLTLTVTLTSSTA